MSDKADLNLKQQGKNTCKSKNSPLKHIKSKHSKTINIMKLSELCNENKIKYKFQIKITKLNLLNSVILCQIFLNISNNLNTQFITSISKCITKESSLLHDHGQLC